QANVVIVGIDDDSLAALDKPLSMISPEIAEVLGHLHDRGAAAIGLDILVPDQLDRIREIAVDAPQVGRQVFASESVVLPAWHLAPRLIKPLSGWSTLDPKSAAPPDDSRFGLVDLTEDGDSILRRQRLLERVDDRTFLHFSLALFAKYSTARNHGAEI